MDMWVHGQRAQGIGFAFRLCDFCPTKPKFRWKEGPMAESVPAAVHFIDRGPKLINWAISDRERQKDGLMSREVFVELWESLEEAPTPCPASAPLAEGAEAAIAGVSRPKERLTGLFALQGDFHANRGRAIPDRLSDVQGLAVHREAGADRCVVPPVLAVRLEYPRMGTGRGSNTAWLCRAMHLVCDLLVKRMLPSTNYKRNPRNPSESLGLSSARPLDVV